MQCTGTVRYGAMLPRCTSMTVTRMLVKKTKMKKTDERDLFSLSLTSTRAMGDWCLIESDPGTSARALFAC